MAPHDPDTVIDKVREAMRRRYALLAKIAEASRPLTAVLKDAGRPHSAEPLAALFFELDALDEEMSEFTKTNLPQILRHMLR